MVKIQTRLSSR